MEVNAERPKIPAPANSQPPRFTGLAVHKLQTEVQNKGTANIYVDVPCSRISNFHRPYSGYEKTCTLLPCTLFHCTLLRHPPFGPQFANNL